MAITLPYGRQVPQKPDSGGTFFDNLEDNIELDDAHTHDGITSPPLTSVIASNVTKQAILAAAWVSVGNGTYRQTVTLPAAITAAPVDGGAGKTFDDVSMEFRLSTGYVIYPSVEKASPTTYYVYINDNSLALTVIYTT